MFNLFTVLSLAPTDHEEIKKDNFFLFFSALNFHVLCLNRAAEFLYA